MKIDENRLLFLIKYAPAVVTLIFYILILIFLYFNYIVFYNKYSFNLSIIAIGITLISLLISFSITKYLENAYFSYKKDLYNEIEINKKKDLILFQQSKLATIGELLGNIAHQWRQPLSVITTAATAIMIQRDLGQEDKAEEKKYLEGIITSANYLSQTIDDFRNFYNPNVPNKDFYISNTIDSSLRIVNSQLKNKGIIIDKVITNFSINGVENELMQVIINIINNARDQLEKSIHKIKIIKIKTIIEENYYLLHIIDNAGGILPEHIKKVFEPYFTTKEHIKGTGIGLFMASEIITKHFNGEIFVKNINYIHNDIEYNGAKFTIKFPIC
ncbi:MAG: sensor histidine kinase [Halarcobacter sp.]